MTSVRLTTLLLALIAFAAVGCTKTVTNNVPFATPSTPQTQSTPHGAGVQGDNGSGGVINGGGGKGVRCTKEGKTTVEVLDLYEAKSLYGLEVLDLGSSEEGAKNKLAELLAKHFWNPDTIPMDRYVPTLKEMYVQQFFNDIRFIDSGKSLKLTNDSFDPVLENGCEPVQIAMYYDESVLLVDKSLWDQLNWTNKMALVAHESLYFLARESGTKNSMSTRKLVGKMFSTKGVRPLADGVPKNENAYVECRLNQGEFYRGRFFLYPKTHEDYGRGLEALFFDFGSDGSLFRTSAFIENISFSQFQAKEFSANRTSKLERDTYPTRDEVSITFKGLKHGEMEAELRMLKGAGGQIGDIHRVVCDLPADVTELDPKIFEPGTFEAKSGGNSVDKLEISATGKLKYETTRQVGGQGGMSSHGVVPYPTVCRYIQYGIATEIDDKWIRYTVINAELGNLEGVKDSEHCPDYIESLNQKAADGTLNFSISKSELTKIN